MKNQLNTFSDQCQISMECFYEEGPEISYTGNKWYEIGMGKPVILYYMFREPKTINEIWDILND
jgi:hypothetical protein